MRWSIPRIHAGRSHTSRARSPATSTIAAAPSDTGGQSPARSGATTYGSASMSSAVTSPRTCANGLPSGAAAAAGRHLGEVGLGPWPPRRAAPGPGARPATRGRPTAASGSRGRSGGRAPRAGRRATRCPSENTSAESMSPCCSRTHASYSAHAPSISTWLSEMGGQAPVASRLPTKANDCAGQVVGAARAGEADLRAGDARALDGLGDHREEHLRLGLRRRRPWTAPARRRRWRRRAHQSTCSAKSSAGDVGLAGGAPAADGVAEAEAAVARRRPPLLLGRPTPPRPACPCGSGRGARR